MSVFATTPGVVTVWSDVGCPWATLALFRLRAAVKAADADLTIDHRVFPLELVNERPTPKRALDVETAVIGSHEPGLAWRPWRARPEMYPVTTLPALEAVQAAKDPRIGGLAASAALDWALREAFYVNSRCISLVTEVLAVARECRDIDDEALAEALRSGRFRHRIFADLEIARGGAVEGSPHVFLADGTDAHNPGVEIAWTRAPGDGYPVIVSDEPAVWVDLIGRATRS